MAPPKSTSRIINKRANRKGRGFFTRILKWFAWLAVLATVMCAGALIGVYFYFVENLPKISSLADYRPPVISTVYADDNRKIGEFFRERRIVIPLSLMPEMLIQAFISAEDSRFYKHPGIDFFSILRAFFKNIEAGGIVQGGSTITQQVTKSFFLTPERSYHRKLKEAILAYRIDKAFTKEEILYLYLNQIYLGHGAYGVEAAAENYFGKAAEELNLAECAIMAGLPQAPTRYSPFRYPEKAKERQIYVLNRMVAEGYISNIQ
ncbi:MAG: transglycosylase domain-containing protein, partial [Desulfobacterales bacterium]|nr:transglycosylase domain-containing protein [Desulfobacterales bacterium]